MINQCGLFPHLLSKVSVNVLIDQWLTEDLPSFDYGGQVVGSKQNEAVLYAKSLGVLAGVPFFNAIFDHLNCQVEWLVHEGQLIQLQASEDRVPVARVRGEASQLLAGERVALNMLARASGIATRAYRLNSLKQEKQWKGQVAGTRKTTPGFRLVEKYAMLVGGVDTHRMDLSSMIMLKDNHIWSHGSITGAVKAARRIGGFSLKIEVECRSIQEAREAIEAGADIVMLDNFEPEALWSVADELKSVYNDGRHKFLIEGSGGLTESNLAQYMSPSVDILSLGCLTQSVPHVDFSLKIVQQSQ